MVIASEPTTRIERNSDVALCIAITGPRGGGKSAFMAYLSIEYGLLADLPVWSTQPITWPPHAEEDKQRRSQSLDLNAFYSMDAQFVGGTEGNAVVAWDEIQFAADSYAGSGKAMRLLSYILIQLRKRNLTFLYTTQDMNFVHARLRKETDIEFRCRDASFTEWGRENHLRRGEKIIIFARDLSGIATGYRFDEVQRWYRRMFDCKGIWGSYDTSHLDDVFDLMRGVDLNLEKRKIGGNGHAEVDGVIANAIGDLVLAGTGVIKASELRQHLSGYGIDLSPTQIGMKIASLGIPRSFGRDGKRYDLTGLAVGDTVDTPTSSP